MLDGSMEDTGHWTNPFTADGPDFPEGRFPEGLSPEQATIRTTVAASTLRSNEFIQKISFQTVDIISIARIAANVYGAIP